MTAAERRAQVRPLGPPYLLTSLTDRHGAGMTVTGNASISVVELAVHGQWSHQLCEQVSAGLRLCLAGPSVSIIIDLQHLDDAYGVSMPFWLRAWRQARLGRCSVHLAFSLPATTALSRRLRTLQGPQPRLFVTALEARMATAERMPRADRLQARLAPLPASVSAARNLVTQACQVWHLPQLLPDMSLIVSELATNAVEHAGTDFIVTVSRDGTGLHVAVHDGTTRFPHPGGAARAGPQAALPLRGRGLALVHTVAAAWGAMPARGGKVVWATV
jgi:anti-sigma regulatory factor (Ser/Thr protein kinase)